MLNKIMNVLMITTLIFLTASYIRLESKFKDMKVPEISTDKIEETFNEIHEEEKCKDSPSRKEIERAERQERICWDSYHEIYMSKRDILKSIQNLKPYISDYWRCAVYQVTYMGYLTKNEALNGCQEECKMHREDCDTMYDLVEAIIY